MRDYGKVSPRFWTGETGKRIRAIGPEAQLVALYLLTAPNSSMTGLYYLPIPVLAHETGLSLQGASKALRSLSEADFAHYDEDHEAVWVPEMARHQIGDALDPKDKRHTGLLRELAPYRKCRFVRAFWERYGSAYHLPAECPFEATSKPLRSQEQEQEQEQEEDTSTSSTAEPPPPAKASGVRAAFEHWQRVMGKPRAKLDGKRERAIAASVARHGLDDCLRAIEGCKASAWHQGENADRRVHNDIELILRDAKHVEMFLDFARQREAKQAAAAAALARDAAARATPGKPLALLTQALRRDGVLPGTDDPETIQKEASNG